MGCTKNFFKICAKIIDIRDRLCYIFSMRPQGTPKELEKRRYRALDLLESGKSVTDVAHRMGCSHSAVILWRDTVSRQGREALKAKPTPGRPPKLSEAQLHRLPKMLLKGPRHCGYNTDVWTTERVADLIERKLGVRYHRAHVSRILLAKNWSGQGIERRLR